MRMRLRLNRRSTDEARLRRRAVFWARCGTVLLTAAVLGGIECLVRPMGWPDPVSSEWDGPVTFLLFFATAGVAATELNVIAQMRMIEVEGPLPHR